VPRALGRPGKFIASPFEGATHGNADERAGRRNGQSERAEGRALLVKRLGFPALSCGLRLGVDGSVVGLLVFDGWMLPSELRSLRSLYQSIQSAVRETRHRGIVTIAWPPLGVSQRLLDLHSARDALKGISGDGSAAEQCLARYLVVRSTGYVEAGRDDVADQYANQQASPRVVSRVRSALRTGEGVRPSQLVSFVRSWDSSWATN